MSFNTLHIFGYGESQLITNSDNIKVPTSDVQASADAVVANVYAQKPQGNDASAQYHAVNIFYDMFADFQPKTGTSFRVQWGDLDAALVDTLATDITNDWNSTTTTTTQP